MKKNVKKDEATLKMEEIVKKFYTPIFEFYHKEAFLPFINVENAPNDV